MAVTITATKNGPYEVEGEAVICDAEGNVLMEKKQGGKVWLCRCGRSAHKPFCDSTHKKVGFTG